MRSASCGPHLIDLLWLDAVLVGELDEAHIGGARGQRQLQSSDLQEQQQMMSCHVMSCQSVTVGSLTKLMLVERVGSISCRRLEFWYAAAAAGAAAGAAAEFHKGVTSLLHCNT
jgi:hypothetical protein